MNRIEKEFDDLRFELRHHPVILADAEKTANIYAFVERVATHCDIMVDGSYTNEQVLTLASKLTDKLYTMRTRIILPRSL